MFEMQLMRGKTTCIILIEHYYNVRMYNITGDDGEISSTTVK